MKDTRMKMYLKIGLGVADGPPKKSWIFRMVVSNPYDANNDAGSLNAVLPACTLISSLKSKIKKAAMIKTRAMSSLGFLARVTTIRTGYILSTVANKIEKALK